jgi:hypothetical protein
MTKVCCHHHHHHHHPLVFVPVCNCDALGVRAPLVGRTLAGTRSVSHARYAHV